MPTPADDLDDLRRRLRDTCERRFDADDAALLQRLARPAVALSPTDEPTRSRLGGPAVLPPGTPWPTWDGKPLSLIAVLDAAELAGFTTDVPLPERSLLNVFYEADEQLAWGFDPAHRDGWRVIPADPVDAAPVATPDGGLTFPAVGLQPRQTLSIPGWEEPALAALGDRYRPDDPSRLDPYLEFAGEWDEISGAADQGHRIGGWPQLVQAPIWEECARASGQVPGAERPVVDPGADPQLGWRLLLQVDSDERAGWMWGDVGTLYYTVRASLPEPARFAEAWMVFQCC